MLYEKNLLPVEKCGDFGYKISIIRRGRAFSAIGGSKLLAINKSGVQKEWHDCIN